MRASHCCKHVLVLVRAQFASFPFLNTVNFPWHGIAEPVQFSLPVLQVRSGVLVAIGGRAGLRLFFTPHFTRLQRMVQLEIDVSINM